jgi:hypothetical protein
MRRWWISIAVLVVLVAAAGHFCTVVAWVGRKTLQIEVHVIDAENQTEIAEAQVVIFRGPSTAFEGWNLPPAADFTVERTAAEPKSAKTDAHGRCNLNYSFVAAGSEGYFRHSGYVDTSGGWLEVSAPD